MMEDTVYRKDVIKALEAMSGGYSYIETTTLGAITTIRELPSAQRTGRWKVSYLPKGKMKYCSECGFGQYIADERQYNFCPNCGAKIQEVEE